MLKHKNLLFAIMISLILAVLIITSCAEPAPAPTPSPAPAPAPSPEPAKKVVLRMAAPWPPDAVPALINNDFVNSFNEKASGAYEIQIFPGETLAKIPEFLDAARTGSIEMFAMALGPYSGLVPVLTEIPMIFDNVRANAAASAPLIDLYNEALPEFNVKALSGFTTGSNEIISTKPIKTMADWKGKLIGSISPGTAALASALGGSPVDIVWSDTYSALEKGVVDASFGALEFVVVASIYDVADFSLSFYAMPSVNAYVINMDTWNKMPANIQNLLLEESEKCAANMNAKFTTLEDEYRATLASHGVEIYILPKDEHDKWKAAVAPYVEKELASLGEYGPKMKAIADKANSENP